MLHNGEYTEKFITTEKIFLRFIYVLKMTGSKLKLY